MGATNSQRGVTLPETMMAVLVATVGVFSMGFLIFQASATNKNQGQEVTRATIYAQDKIEKLLSLGALGPLGQLGVAPNYVENYNNCTQTATYQETTETGTPCNTTGITDSGWTQGLLAGGMISLPPPATGPPTSCGAVPTAGKGYVDFLDSRGTQLQGACTGIPPASIAYIRMWQLTDLSAATSPPSNGATPAAKQITVAVYSQIAVNYGVGKPITVVTSLLSNPN